MVSQRTLIEHPNMVDNCACGRLKTKMAKRCRVCARLVQRKIDFLKQKNKGTRDEPRPELFLR